MDSVKIFKEIVDELYSAMPHEAKKEIYDNYLNRYKARSIFRKILSSQSGMTKRKQKAILKGYGHSIFKENKMIMPDAVKHHIIKLLMSSEYCYLISDKVTIKKICYLFDISRIKLKKLEDKLSKLLDNEKNADELIYFKYSSYESIPIKNLSYS